MMAGATVDEELYLQGSTAWEPASANTSVSWHCAPEEDNTKQLASERKACQKCASDEHLIAKSYQKFTCYKKGNHTEDETLRQHLFVAFVLVKTSL